MQEEEKHREAEPPVGVEGITPEQFQKMGVYLLQGMNEVEAATLAGIDKLKLSVARRTSNLYNDFVELKRLEFKAKHLRVLSTKPDSKVSQWLLERLAPHEFGSKTKAPDVPTNVIGAIIKEIQEGAEDTSSLSFAYKDLHENKSRHTQGAPRAEAVESIRKVLE